MKKFELTFGTYKCRYYFDIDCQVEGIDVYTEQGNRIGSALINLPDDDDKESVQKFKSELENWIIENE